MKIAIPDDIAKRIGLSKIEMTEFLAVCLYKKKIISGAEGGKILGTSQIAFHGLLEKFNEYVNYDIDEYPEDPKNLKHI